MLQNDADIKSATEHYQKFILSFLKARRIEQPLWLSSVLFQEKRQYYFARFMNIFSIVMDKLEAPSRKMFVSTVLTGVLMHHLSWIRPFLAADNDMHSGEELDTATDEDDEPKDSPQSGSSVYIKQLISLYGSGYLNELRWNRRKETLKRFCRIVVIGNDKSLVTLLLHFLSYFVRCGEILEANPVLSKDDEANKGSFFANYKKRDQSSAAGQNCNHPGTDPSQAPNSIGEGSPPAKISDAASPGQKPQQSQSPSVSEHASKGPTFSGSPSRPSSASEQPSVEATALPSASSPLEKESSSKEADDDENTPVKIVPLLKNQSYEYLHHPPKSKLTFGSTLFADACRDYCGSFVMMGMPHDRFIGEAITDMHLYSSEPFMGDDRPPDVVSYVIADIERQLCTVFALGSESMGFAHRPKTSTVHPSSHVVKMLGELRALKQMDFPDYSLEGYFNDKLGDIYLKSKVLANIIQNHHYKHMSSDMDDHSESSISFELPDVVKLARKIGLDHSDLSLLLSVASVQNSSSRDAFVAHSVIPKKQNNENPGINSAHNSHSHSSSSRKFQ